MKLKLNKLVFFATTLCLASSVWATNISSEQAEQYKQNFKYGFILGKRNVPAVLLTDRYEADALLEAASNGVLLPNHSKKSELRSAHEILLVMPRIDLLQKHLAKLSTKTKHLYLFIMEDDKLAEPYGDRSYQTFIKKGLDKKLPRNVKLFSLKNESVTSQTGKNRFEYPTPFSQSAVFNHQILPIFYSITTVKDNYPER